MYYVNYSGSTDHKAHTLDQITVLSHSSDHFSYQQEKKNAFQLLHKVHFMYFDTTAKTT